MGSDRVLAEMASIGLRATELGPDGFLPTDPDDLVEYVKSFDLDVIGGFIPAVLYRDDLIEDTIAQVRRSALQLASTGSDIAIIGPDSHYDGYDTDIEMSETEWKIFSANLSRLTAVVGEYGVATSVHPHWGMAISRRNHIERFLDSSDAGLCLDTGHLYLSGADPLDIAKMAGSRIDHVHLKDVDDQLAAKVRSGELPFRQAVIDGVFKPLGEGVLDIGELIRHLESSGYKGWYVLEQDCALSDEPAEGEGPGADAATSVSHLRAISADL